MTPVLEARSLRRVHRSGHLALDDVSVSINDAARIGIVGESGAGKSTLVRALLGLEPLTAGDVLFEGTPLPQCDGVAFRRAVQPVFQDPRSSLNPRLTVGRIVAEPLECLGIDVDHAVRVKEVLADVALDASFAQHYPHELSGGQRQRVAIARALAPSPRVLIADEPVSALDVLIRDEIVALLNDLIGRKGLSLVLVSHDLAVVARLCTDIAVMRDGRIVEHGPIARVVGSPVDELTRRIVALATSGSR